ncbi:MAG: DNA repair protein RadA [Candidatus Tyrphobacter sp.]
MRKTRSAYECSACGFASPRWLGRCPQCGQWNSLGEARLPTAGAARTSTGTLPTPLREIDERRVERIATGIAEFDATLGGGIVPGSLTLLGGPPGAGKSTLALQVASHLCEVGAVVYLCGEESAAQVKLRAKRLRLGGDVLVAAQTDLRAVLDGIQAAPPVALVVDSIQTVWLEGSESYAGSVSQIRDCTQALMEFAKSSHCATILVGHVTKDGAIAGPRLLEHLVDTVLYFEGDLGGEYRILRAYKNRFGSVDEIAVFTIGESGLVPVANPSSLFAGEMKERASGSCIVASILGSRPVLVEVQALVGETTFGTPRRLANNVDQARLAMIVAVLERHAGMELANRDIYVSVAGGLRVVEPAADLGIALAIASSSRNRTLRADAAVFGELGLSGELRPVSGAARREAEARRLGYATLWSPSNASSVRDALARALA